MREFKFRGKRIDNGEWVYGYIWIIPGVNLYYILTGKIDIRDWAIEKYEIDPKTLGQYIGLKDRNGIEIYKGDIVANTMNDKLVVVRHGKYMDVFGDTWYGFYYEGTNYNYKILADTSSIYVIDNIYENQNLIKELKINE